MWFTKKLQSVELSSSELLIILTFIMFQNTENFTKELVLVTYKEFIN